MEELAHPFLCTGFLSSRHARVFMMAWSADQCAEIRAHPLSKHADKCVKGTLRQKSHQLCVSPAVFTHPCKSASDPQEHPTSLTSVHQSTFLVLSCNRTEIRYKLSLLRIFFAVLLMSKCQKQLLNYSLISSIHIEEKV